MIKNLKLENFVIVDNMEISFQDGLQVLTGETGAGKSVIAGAINVVFGAKIVSGMLFHKEKNTRIEVTFDIDKDNKILADLLKENEVDVSEKELYFCKEIGIDLKAKCFLNGRRISNRLVKEFREQLIDFHRQKDQQKLLENDYQLEVLDYYGDLYQERNKVNQTYNELNDKLDELSKLEQKEKEQQDRIKLYQYQEEELKAVGLELGEDDKLQKELNILNHSEEIINLSNSLQQIIYEEENSVYDLLNDYYTKLDRFREDNDNIKASVSHLQDVLANLDDVVSTIRKVQDEISIDRSLMSEIQERLDLINNLKSKYKRNLKEILQYSEEIKLALKNYSSDKEEISKLKQEVDEIWHGLRKQATSLSRKRKQTAKNFELEIGENIKKLAMPDADIKIRFDSYDGNSNGLTDLKGYSSSGIDRIEIMFTANRGVRMQPLKEAASGGELSRFLLTVKKILSNRLERRTIILDEIDTGIGGKTSQLLGEFIYDIARIHQVLCITHLAQIASFADDHYGIEKQADEEFTTVKLKKLSSTEKRNEIARMLSGNQTDIALKYADEILNKEEITK